MTRVPPHLLARLLYANPVCFLVTANARAAGADSAEGAAADGPAGVGAHRKRRREVEDARQEITGLPLLSLRIAKRQQN